MKIPGRHWYGMRWLIMAGLLMSSMLRAQDDGADDDISRIPQRPTGHILDSAKWLTLAEREETGRELDRLYRDNQIDIYLVTRAKHPPQGASSYARALGNAWSRSPMWCVIFYVPGDPAGFHAQAGGVGLDQERVDRVVAEASKRARKEATEKERVRAAWEECSQMLRFLHATGQRENEKLVEKKLNMREKLLARYKWKKILIVGGVGSVFFLAIGAWLMVGMIRKKKFPSVFEFPETSWRTRYQAPHSGGSGLVVKYRPPQSKELEVAEAGEGSTEETIDPDPGP